MSTAMTFPAWVSAMIADMKRRAEKLAASINDIERVTSLQRRRALWFASVRDFFEIDDQLTRFKFFLRAGPNNNVKELLIELGRKIDMDFEEVASTMPTTRNVLFVDTETTGLGAADEPITIAAVLVAVDSRSGWIRQEHHSYYGEREPHCSISPGAAKVHGITIDQVSGKTFDLAQLVSMFGVSDFVVAHNADFDRRMLRVALPDQYDWRCSMRSVNWPPELEGRSLDALCEHFAVQRAWPHNAMSDVRALISVLRAQRSDGRTFLADLLH